MFKKSILAAALLTAAFSSAHAVTVIGGATLSDNATVHPTTVTPTTYLTYLIGGGATGTADGTTWTPSGATPAAAMATADHLWAQFDPAIFMTSGNVALTSLLAIPAIDHGWTPGNTGSEPWESFEFKIWGCTAAALSSCTEGHITDVYTLGVDDTGTGKNADDWATVWAFDRPYTIFAITSGDRLVGGPFSAGEGEIDALAVVAVPEPSELMLMLAGLGAMGFMSRRRRRQA